MPNLYNAGELATIIKKLGEKDTPDLGPDNDSVNTYIFYFMNIAMMKLARLAFNVQYSDELALSADDFVTFKKSGTNIADLYEPQMITYIDNGVLRQLQKRTADDAPYGWWRESQNQEIHIRGFGTPGGGNKPLPATGYTLKYIRYPKKVTLETDIVEFPPSGYDTLIKEVLSLIKYPKNSYAGADFMDGKAKQGYNNLVQAGISARGTGTSGQPLAINDSTQAKG